MFGNYLKDFISGDIWFSENENVAEKKIISAPSEYVECYLDNISVERLHEEHNILLKTLEIEGILFIHSIVMLNEPKEFDCYNDGENVSVIIRNVDEGVICIIAKEKTGKEEKVYIRKGKIQFKLN